jgi:hypothetical protein
LAEEVGAFEAGFADGGEERAVETRVFEREEGVERIIVARTWARPPGTPGGGSGPSAEMQR